MLVEIAPGCAAAAEHPDTTCCPRRLFAAWTGVRAGDLLSLATLSVLEQEESRGSSVARSPTTMLVVVDDNEGGARENKDNRRR